MDAVPPPSTSSPAGAPARASVRNPALDRLAVELDASWLSWDPSEADLDGMQPSAIASPPTPEAVAFTVAVAERLGLAIVPWGNGTHIALGNPPSRYDVALRTARLGRILEHNAGDLTVTAEAGTTLAELDAVLARAGQWLPLDPASFPSVSVGGLIAADLNGSLRFTFGKVRDCLLGIRAAIGGGKLVRGGGRVVKNVAGYDLPKLFTGSFGTLGIVVEATLKVRPRPAADIPLAAPCADLEAAFDLAAAVQRAPVSPVGLDVADAGAAQYAGLPARPHVIARLAGGARETAAQLDAIGNLNTRWEKVRAETLTALRDFPARGPGKAGVRASVPPRELAATALAIAREAGAFRVEVPLLAHAGSGVLRLRVSAEVPGGELPFLHWVRFLCRQSRGSCIAERLPSAQKRGFDVWGTPSAPLELARGVKRALDPHCVFSPGRFVGGL